MVAVWTFFVCLLLPSISTQPNGPIAQDKLGILYPRDNVDLSHLSAHKTVLVVEYFRPFRQESSRFRSLVDKASVHFGPGAQLLPFARISIETPADDAALPWLRVVYRGRIFDEYRSSIHKEEILFRWLHSVMQRLEMPVDETHLLEKGVRLMDETDFLLMMRSEKERTQAARQKRLRKQFAREKFGFNWEEGQDNHEIPHQEKDSNYVDGMGGQGNDGSVPSDDWRDNLEGVRDDEDLEYEDEGYQENDIGRNRRYYEDSENVEETDL